MDGENNGSKPYEQMGWFGGVLHPYLVGGFNPSEKYARQIGPFPQVGMKIKNIWNHHLAIFGWKRPSWKYTQLVSSSRY